MNQDLITEPLAKPLSSQNDNQRPFFGTAVLSKFMRLCYGPYAPSETQHRLKASIRKADFEMAGTWKRVLAHLQSFEIEGD